jgi:hypothetical protein
VVTFDGFPLGYEVFAGNTHDSRTLQTIVATMEARHGMASNKNLAWLRATGRRYIIGAPKSELKKFAAELACADGWRTVHDGVEVKLARQGETDETVILVRSADRRSKEKAMHDKFSQRIDAALQRLANRLARAKKPIDPARVNRQIGRLLQRNQRAAARFAIALEPDSCVDWIVERAACPRGRQQRKHLRRRKLRRPALPAVRLQGNGRAYRPFLLRNRSVASWRGLEAHTGAIQENP